MSTSDYYENQPLARLVSRVSWYARQRMFKTVMAHARPDKSFKVLDVGVTSDRRQESNFLERLYPYKANVIAVGLEDAGFLMDEFSGITFLKADGSNLPFADKHFDLVTCFAVIEHAGNIEAQCRLVRELCRVARRCFITTPNRWYPMEFHTGLPLVHWLPKSWHRTILRIVKQDFWSSEDNLNLLSADELKSMFPDNAKITTDHFRLLGFVSNLCFYSELRDS